MSDMRCSLCGRYGTRWAGWRFDNFTHAECPHCGGVNCQEIDPDPGDQTREDDPANQQE